MDKLVIAGGRPLEGRVAISGAKNAALPILAAAILTEDTLRVENVPRLRDVATTTALLTQMGMWVRQSAPGVYELSGHALSNPLAPYDLVKEVAEDTATGPYFPDTREAPTMGDVVVAQEALRAKLVDMDESLPGRFPPLEKPEALADARPS